MSNYWIDKADKDEHGYYTSENSMYKAFFDASCEIYDDQREEIKRLKAEVAKQAEELICMQMAQIIGEKWNDMLREENNKLEKQNELLNDSMCVYKLERLATTTDSEFDWMFDL